MLAREAVTNVAEGRDPIVVLAADDHFAMPLAATLRSALDNLAPAATLRIYILDGGIKDATKRRLLRSWPEGRYRVEWLAVDAAALAGSPVSGHVNLVSYYRILIPRLLPSDLRRVIYLDSDLIIREDLARLWNQDPSGQPCLAVQDCSAPYLDSSQALANYRSCAPYLACAEPIPNFRQLGLPGTAAYFNAGVLVIDLDAWRKDDLAGQMLACLVEHQEHVRWWDQYALNVVLAGRWGKLDARWNQGSHIYYYPTWEQSPYDRSSFERLVNEPYIVHYTTGQKPWRARCRHPLRHLFFEYVDRTDWAGWRPPLLRVALELAKVPERRLRQARKWLTNQVRQWFRGGREPSTS